MAVPRPTTAYLKKTMLFFSYRIKAHKQLASQLFHSITVVQESHTIYTKSTSAQKWEDNVMKMCLLIADHEIFYI